ncbi:MAG: serine/threonine-protein kinase [Pirellulales bacterium]
MSLEPTLEQSGEERRRSREQSLKRSRPPLQVPGYEAKRHLGAGAYGEVWMAVNKNTGQKVAIKFYAHRGGLDWALLSREVEKLSFLFGDRYSVQLLDVGWEADPPYFVMEYMEHGSLEDRLKDGPLPAHEVLGILQDVAMGLVHAHGKGVLHCDLKPANVLLDEDGRPRLADFGQSRLSYDQTAALGTLYFMAPEQADLEGSPDARWDVYALGALIYCLLVGHPPLSNRPEAAALDAPGPLADRLRRYQRLINDSPQPAEHRKVDGVDRHLAEIVDKCLAANPKRRYRNVQAVVDALHERSVRKARRPLLLLGAAGPALFLLVVALFGWLAYSAAMSESTTAVTQKTLETNYYAAQLVAESVAGKIDHRWRVLSEEAAQPEFVKLLKAAAAVDQLGSDEWKALGEWLIAARARAERSGLASTSWFATNADGLQLARDPFSITVGRRFARRDYFNGRGEDFASDEGLDLTPIRHAHKSVVFPSKATHNLMVAFSVPVWDVTTAGDEVASDSISSGGAPADGVDATVDRQPIGILAMTVELGEFAELLRQRCDEADSAGRLADAQHRSG